MLDKKLMLERTSIFYSCSEKNGVGTDDFLLNIGMSKNKYWGSRDELIEKAVRNDIRSFLGELHTSIDSKEDIFQKRCTFPEKMIRNMRRINVAFICEFEQSPFTGNCSGNMNGNLLSKYVFSNQIENFRSISCTE